MLPSDLVLLEGKDGKECCKHSTSCAPCHLPIEGAIHPERTDVPKDLPCFVCGVK
jgi:hypothetical protein